MWSLQLSFGHSTIGCKWIYKIKRNASSNIERYKPKLVVKEFTKKKGINYQRTFYLVSKNDSLELS